MRVLSAVDICDEATENSYRSNPVTEYLNAPGQTAGMEIVSAISKC